MKTRNGFVTNSSSSSFIIKKKYLSEVQVDIIKNLDTMTSKKAERLKSKLSGMQYFNDWDLEENDKYIAGATTMNNFMYSELFELLGIDQYVNYGDSCYIDIDSIDELYGYDDEEFQNDDDWEDD